MVTSKPYTEQVDVDGIPDTLKQLDRWVGWRWTYDENQRSKWTKAPVKHETGYFASSTDPNTWSSWETAHKNYMEGNVDGVGIVLIADDALAGIDLDHIRDSNTGYVEPWALKIVSDLNSYAEVSPSGTGLRIFAKGTLPSGRRKRGDIEAYETERFLTVTGQRLEEAAYEIEHRQVGLAQFHSEYLADNEDEERPVKQIEFSQDAPASDYAIMHRMFESLDGDKTRQLYEGYADGYPSVSEADLALCSKIVFWTQNYEQIDRIFRGSRLIRDKWDELRGQDTYGDITIKQALRASDTVFVWKINTDDESVSDKIQRFLKFGSPKLKGRRNARL